MGIVKPDNTENTDNSNDDVILSDSIEGPNFFQFYRENGNIGKNVKLSRKKHMNYQLKMQHSFTMTRLR